MTETELDGEGRERRRKHAEDTARVRVAMRRGELEGECRLVEVKAICDQYWLSPVQNGIENFIYFSFKSMFCIQGGLKKVNHF